MKGSTPVHPSLVLVLATLLPGAGHVAIGQPQRGFGFAFYTLLLALLTWHLSTPEISFVGRSAGGLFIWALSIPDAYRAAKLNFEVHKFRRQVGFQPQDR